MSEHANGGLELPPPLMELVTEAAKRLPAGPGVTCCLRHTIEALIEYGSRAILGREPPGLDRRVESLTVRELVAALGLPDVAAAREAVAHTLKAKQDALDESTRIARDLKAVGGGTLARLSSAAELRAFLEPAVGLMDQAPIRPLVLLAVWVDDDAAGKYAPGPAVVSKAAN